VIEDYLILMTRKSVSNMSESCNEITLAPALLHGINENKDIIGNQRRIEVLELVHTSKWLLASTMNQSMTIMVVHATI
jgi:hypothetical protein